MMIPYRSRLIFGGWLIAIACICAYLPAQQSNISQNSTDRISQELLLAPNAWQATPVDLQTQVDNVSPEVRADRNRYWINLINEQRKVIGDLALAEPMAVFPGAWLETDPEVPLTPHSVWVIAKFNSFHVYKTAIDSEHQWIYTEMNFQVVQVIKQPHYLRLVPGVMFDLATSGGRIKNKDGTITTSRVSRVNHCEQPDHTYLLQLVYDPTSPYLVESKWWDVTSGKVVPDTGQEIDRASKGNSVLNGMTTDDAIAYLQSHIPSE